MNQCIGLSRQDQLTNAKFCLTLLYSFLLFYCAYFRINTENQSKNKLTGFRIIMKTQSEKRFKGALDKSNIYLFISSSIKGCKSN